MTMRHARFDFRIGPGHHNGADVIEQDLGSRDVFAKFDLIALEGALTKSRLCGFVVLMNEPNPDPLMVTTSSNPAEAGVKDSIVGTTSVNAPAVVDTVPRSLQQDPSAAGGAPRV